MTIQNYVVTIARGFGSGGKEIGSRLSKALGIPCYEKEILQMAADETGLGLGIFQQVDEKVRGSYIRKTLQSFKPPQAVVEPTEKNFVSDENLFQIQAEIIKTLAKTQSCIIIGKCADHLLRGYDNVVSVYVEAPRAACVQTVMEKLNVPEKRAHQLIRDTDRYRSNYYWYYTRGGDWTNPVNYDMTLNSASLGWDRCVRMIEACLRVKLGLSV